MRVQTDDVCSAGRQLRDHRRRLRRRTHVRSVHRHRHLRRGQSEPMRPGAMHAGNVRRAGYDCGDAPDGCGGTLRCGTCQAPNSCGGGGSANHCGCTAKTCDEIGAKCGNPDNGCGKALSCGTCKANKVCTGYVCVKP